VKQILKRVCRAAGYRVERWRPANRFNAMSDALELLRRRGFRPGVVIDGGANVGDWTRMALDVFPGAPVHLIEPQPACQPALERLAHTSPRLTVHPVALTEPGRSRVNLTGGAAEGGTGVHVTLPQERDVEVECPATTLDQLFANRIGRADRALLKLDLEGHELSALKGGEALLAVVEVIVLEVQLYDINDSGAIPVFSDVFHFLDQRGFILYDVATTGWRRRDLRMCMMDPVFARAGSELCADRSYL
jgi:FkbM family methyltransferase